MFTPRPTNFPSMGAGRGGQRIQECATSLSLRAIADGVAISFLLLCRSGAYAPCAYPRICSNCAVACFHILGFIAREQRDRGDPVDNKVARIRVRTLLTGLLRCARNDKYDVIHITWIPWSSPRMTRWRKTRPRMTKRIQSTKNPHMIIFALQDMWQTNKINTKHVPNLNGGLLPAWGDECFVKYYQLSLQYLCFYQTRTARKW